MVVITRHKYATAHSKAAYLCQIGAALRQIGEFKRKFDGEGASSADMEGIKDNQILDPGTVGYILSPTYNKVYYYNTSSPHLISPNVSKDGGFSSGSFNYKKFFDVEAKQKPE